jgi:hypothetical protein
MRRSHHKRANGTLQANGTLRANGTLVILQASQGRALRFPCALLRSADGVGLPGNTITEAQLAVTQRAGLAVA